MKMNIYVYLFDGYSDWEIAYLTPEINKSGNHDLIYVSENGNSVKSMGGLHVKPASSLSQINIEELDLLILPGGEVWEKGNPKAIETLLKETHKLEKPVAAICAATTFLGRFGMLDKVRHTSNDINYLKAIAPEYKGEDYYQNALAFSDKNIITANGIAPIEFAREVFRKVNLYEEDHLEKWFQLFKNGIWKE